MEDNDNNTIFIPAGVIQNPKPRPLTREEVGGYATDDQLNKLAEAFAKPTPKRDHGVTEVHKPATAWAKPEGSLGSVDHFGRGCGTPTLRTKSERKARRGQTKGNSK